ncbi:hypothetical protein K474DRAFT_1671835 [Panus rudis PR-1116 ss-1]|nr:hypothetical protein K474DRAFT_1671835 [Panus rudis PR-1116 ss-1]
MFFRIVSSNAQPADTSGFYEPMKPGIIWGPCPGYTSCPNSSCGHLDVPLDWHDATIGKGRIAVMRCNATAPESERRGVLFTNVGSVSGESLVWMGWKGDALMNQIVNGTYDIVSWDIRGGSKYQQQLHTIIPCFKSMKEQSDFWTKQYQPLGSPNASTHDEGIERTDHDNIHQYLQKYEDLAKECLHAQQTYYPNIPLYRYMGMSANVRDLVALADYLQGPGSEINFYGVGHGSLIGSYLMYMFPDRVGRMILDSPVDPLVYAHQPTIAAWKRDLIDANESFSLFADRCAEERCELVNGYTAGKYAQFFMRKVKSNLAWTRSIMNGWRTAFDADLVDNPTLEKFAQVMHNATQVSGTSVTPLDYYNWMQQFDSFMNGLAKNSGMTTIFAISCGDHGSNPNAWIEPERQIGRDAVAQAIHNVTKAVPLSRCQPKHSRWCNTSS